MSSPYYRSPEKVLKALGIDQPEDIWIEAIAEECHATIGMNEWKVLKLESSDSTIARLFQSIKARLGNGNDFRPATNSGIGCATGQDQLHL